VLSLYQAYELCQNCSLLDNSKLAWVSGFYINFVRIVSDPWTKLLESEYYITSAPEILCVNNLMLALHVV
jgi:hypothetical protein